MWTRLFYDKFANDHQFTNTITSKVSIEDLDNGTFTYYSGQDALTLYNANFDEYFKLPDCVISSDLYRLELYTKLFNNQLTYYTVIGINNNLLKNIVEQNQPIPHVDFLKSLAIFHSNYEDRTRSYTDMAYYTSSTARELICKNAAYITERANQAVDYTFDDRIGPQKNITIEPFDYQKCSVQWMIDRENNPINILYNLNYEIKIGDVYFDTIIKTFYLASSRKNLSFKGGCIIDEVGLGKTLEIILLALNNPAKDTAYLSEDSQKIFKSRATLVLCPNQLCGQWVREIKTRVSKSYDVNIVQLLTKRDFDKFTYQDLLDADFVIVSYNFLENPVFTDSWVPKVSQTKNFFKLHWSTTDTNIVRQTFANMAEELTKNPIHNLSNTMPLIQLIKWHRIAVDEFHEVYSNSKYNYMKNILSCLHGVNLWGITATPFIGDNLLTLKYIIDFLTEYKNQDEMNILTQNIFIEFLSGSCFRRNTKKSVKDEHTLPPIQEVIRWLNFTPTERMMYNAYLANPNNDKFSTYIRQLCCHPQLADETKHMLANCKSLQDIEIIMIKHYQDEVNKAQHVVDGNTNRIAKLSYQIKLVKDKQLVKLLLKNKMKIPKEIEYVLVDNTPDIYPYQNLDNLDFEDHASNKQINIQIDYSKPVIGATGKFDINGNFVPELTEALKNLETYFQILQQRLGLSNNILDGKKATLNFFTNVVERIRKTVTRKPSLKKVKIPNPNVDTSKMTSTQKLLAQMSDSSDASDNEEDKENQENQEDKEDKEDVEQCGICLGTIPEDDVGVTRCGHIFCYKCLQMMIQTNSQYHIKSTCPYCKKSVTERDITLFAYIKPKVPIQKEGSGELTKEEFINLVGTKLANLIWYLKESNEHTIIFSQWDDLLKRVGVILDENGIENGFLQRQCVSTRQSH